MKQMNDWRSRMTLFCVFLLPLILGAQQQNWKTFHEEVKRLHQQQRYSEGIVAGEEALRVTEQELGTNHNETAVALGYLAFFHKELGNYAKAIPLNERALAIAETVLGPENLAISHYLINMARLCEYQGQDIKALPLYKRALAIQEKALGMEHPDVAMSLRSLAIQYRKQGQHAQAEPLFKRALAIQEKALGSEHPEVANSLNSLAILYVDQGQYAQAIPLDERALAIQEKALGPDHPEVATRMNNLGLLYCRLFQFAQAEPFFKRALEIWEKTLGPWHLTLSINLVNLAKMNADQGLYQQAVHLFERALAISERALGQEHPDLAEDLTSLAVLYLRQGRFAKAEPLFKRALAIQEKALGPDHPEVARSLTCLAGFHLSQGAYQHVEPLIRRSLAIQEKALGPDHPDMADNLNILSCQYIALGQYTQAEPLFKRALAITEKALGSDDPALTTLLNNLAQLYFYQDQFTQVEPLVRRALAITEKALGPEHLDVAKSLKILAKLYRLQCRFTQAEPLFKRALAITEKALGPEHRELAENLNSLAVMYCAQGEYAQAEPLYTRALSILHDSSSAVQASTLSNLAKLKSAQGLDAEALALRLKVNTIVEHLIAQTFSFSSEEERFQFLKGNDTYNHLFITLCVERLGKEGAEAGLAFLLRHKGLVLDSLVEEAEAAQLSSDPALKELVARLRTTKNRLASLALAGPEKQAPEQYQANIKNVQTQIEEMERALARQSSRFRALRADRKVSLPDVVAGLLPGSALVEFAKYRSFDFKAKLAEPRWGTEKYIAYVLRQGDKEPILIKLGEAEGIDRLVKDYQTALRSLIQKNARGSDVKAAAEALENAVWAPVKAALGPVKRVHLSLDGELNFVSFAALRDKTGRYVLEDYDISYVSSGRDLARRKIQGEKTQKSTVLFGAPDFGGTAEDPNQEMITRAGGFHSELATFRAFDGLRFAPLPGTRKEVSGIEKLTASKGMKPELYLGAGASEERVKAIKQPRILHLATHGFFLPESGWAVRAEDDKEGWNTGESNMDLGKWKLKNPMYRSGLALAGANLTLAGKAKEGQEDGILTAEEVAGMDLAGTELVVLSACETGMGEAKGGEGVLGLRRALVQAGAENLVMALWSVSDEATQKLMTAMYGKYLSGQPVWKALLDSQREALASERKAGREPNPFLWGAFVANGIGVQ